MLEMISGSGLGLNTGSLAVLGEFAGGVQTAAEGRNGEQAYVNVATGDLVLQDTDGLLMGLGLDELDQRTYNSQGLANGSNNDGWMSGQYKSVTLQSNGTLLRTDSDGSTTSYAWNAGQQLFVETTSTGSAVSTIHVDSGGTYTWTNGATGATETYQGSGAGLIESARDTSGNTLTFGYNGSNQLVTVTDGSGESINYTYTGSNLTGLSTTLKSGQVLNQVSYGYDSLNRLTTVSVNLNPSGAALPAGSEGLTSYTTSYSYDGTSTRVTGVTQSDGTTLGFTYVLANGRYQVASMTDGDGNTTSFAYNTASGQTTVTDPLGVSTVYQYNVNGQLTQVQSGVTAATPAGLSQQNYTYTVLGDVATIVDGLGRTTTLSYDGNGNLLSRVDSGGDTVQQTYTAQNQVQTETTYATAVNGVTPASQPLTTRYVYSASNGTLLRFVLSPEGRVTEYLYNAQGLRTSAIEFQSGTYNTGSLGQTAVPTEASMVTWASAQNLTLSQRTDYVYDFRGQLTSSTTYGSISTSGSGVATTASTTQYVYDQRGELLQTVTPDGRRTTQMIYDGLGRLVSTVASTTDGTPTSTTLTQYDDADGKTTLTYANGLSKTSAYDGAGRLISVLQASGGTTLGTTLFGYDADGRLRMVTDPSGEQSYTLYDQAGRKVADIDPTGQLTEYVYDASGEVTETIRYATAVSTSGLVDGNGNPTNVSLASLRPASSANDQKSWTLYDSAGRVAWQVDAVGDVTQTQYDGASRVTSVTRFATAINSSLLGNGQGVTLSLTGSGSGIIQVSQAAGDRTSTMIYGQDGLLYASIDGEGYLTVYGYNAAGQEVSTVAYANPVSGFTNAASIASQVAAAQSSGSVSGLVPTANSSDIKTFTYYNDQGLVNGQVDGDGNLTETVYTSNGQVAQTIRYATPATGPVTTASTLASLRPTSSSSDQITSNTWDALGRLSSQTNADGAVTRYGYDSVGHVVSVTTASGTSVQRSLLTQYNAQGQVTAELSGVGAALLTGNQTQAQISAIWAQYATTYSYDAAGRLTSQTDPLGDRTVFFYDNAGRLRYTVSATGDVSETQYDAMGHVLSTSQYATALTGSALTGLVGGVLSASANQAAATALAAAKAASSGNSTVSYSYNAVGERILTSDLLGGQTTTRYDAFGEVASQTQAFSASQSVTGTESYDRRGLETKTVSDVGGKNITAGAIYDADGRLIWAVDGTGAVTKQSYDGDGNMIEQIRYATPVTGWVPGTVPPSVASKVAQDRDQKTIYNALGQAIYTLSSMGDGTQMSVVALSYDDMGNVVSRTAYAYTISAGTAATATAVQAAVAAVANSVATTAKPEVDETTRYVYDAQGRLAWSVNGAGAVTQLAYDADGHLVKQVAYAQPIAAGVNPSTVTATAGMDRVSLWAYDNAGRLKYSIDALGSITETDYDAAGNVVQQKAYATQVAAPTVSSVAPSATMVPATNAGDRSTRFLYDAENRLVYTVDASGAVTRNVYDADGRVIARTSYATPLTASTLATLPIGAAASALQPVLDASDDRTVLYGYDEAGHQIYSVDAMGFVTKNTFDDLGRITNTTLYATAVTGLSAGSSATDIGTAIATNQMVATSTSRSYDAAGNLLSDTDGTGDTESYTYDGLGNKLTFTNRNGAIWSYKYDAAGRLIQETDPGVSVTSVSVNSSGNLVAGNPALNTPIVTQLTYDGLGNLTSRTEAAGNPSARTTTYQYDALGHQIKVTYPAVGVYSYSASDLASLNAGNSTRPDTTLSLTTQTIYDSFGDAVANIDVAGNVTTMAYDAMGRVRYQVDALGYVTGYQRDTFGDVVGLTRYANATTLNAGVTSAGAGIPTAITVAAGIATNSADRTITTTYDFLGRAVQVTQPSTWVSDGQGHSYQGAEVTQTSYNAFGEIFQTAVLAAAPNGLSGSTTWAYTTNYYDHRGEQIGTIDALGDVTQQSFDAAGNLKTHTEYATALAGWTGANAPGSWSSVTLPGSNAADRTTSYSYDQDNRKISQTQVGISYGYGTVASGYNYTTGNATTSYTYDKVGNQTSATDALNNTTYTYYDALGRITAVVAPDCCHTSISKEVGVDESGNPIYIQVFVATLPLTTFQRDAFGNVVVKTQYANGATNVSVGGYTAGTLNPTADRTTMTAYDSHGNAIETAEITNTDSNIVGGVVNQYMSYTALGQLTRSWQMVTGNSGPAQVLYTIFGPSPFCMGEHPL